ncbi:MAG: hypothetical protein SPJ11_03490, partial [Coprococcus catus]|nr:hypothetical protein [Coprococcus catus]
MDWAFFKKDLQYIFLNQIVSSIPSWTIRNFFYKCSGMKIGPKARIGINTVIISPKGIKRKLMLPLFAHSRHIAFPPVLVYSFG